jgi:MinD superfamily P-loop ATPase
VKQLLILSGKGGTGKTTVAGAFIRLSDAKAYADCDVDAPNLHLALQSGEPDETSEFKGLPKAVIDQNACVSCGICRELCRFDAIRVNGDGFYEVDFFACEGCGVCKEFCPADAITMEEATAGDLMLYKDDSIFSTARLRMGFGNSGLLVTEVKKQLSYAPDGTAFAVIDGSPGIGCPVIASITGVDMVLVVTEPSLSGISDMQRILDTAKGFLVKTAVCINKYDINMDNTENIVSLCKKRGVPVTGMIPYDNNVLKALNDGVSVTGIDCPAGRSIREVYKKTMKILNEQGDRT